MSRNACCFSSRGSDSIQCTITFFAIVTISDNSETFTTFRNHEVLFCFFYIKKEKKSPDTRKFIPPKAIYLPPLFFIFFIKKKWKKKFFSYILFANWSVGYCIQHRDRLVKDFLIKPVLFPLSFEELFETVTREGIFGIPESTPDGSALRLG